MPADPVTGSIPVGKGCKVEGDCDLSFDGVGICSNALFLPDSTDPNPVCVANGCKLGVGTAIGRCGTDSVGICVGFGASTVCLSSCSFNRDDGAAPVGCLGRNACYFYGVDSSSGTKKGLGYCSGGCVADADCTGGGVCQIEDGVCVAKLKGYTKAVGASCTSDAECACRTDATGTKGFCTKFCLVGSARAACPTGFACDANLPADFSKTPTGIAGECRPKCTTDAECAAFGGRCEPSVGVCRS